MHIEIAADFLAKAVDETIAAPDQTEGAKMLNIMEKHGLLGCMQGDGSLSVD